MRIDALHPARESRVARDALATIALLAIVAVVVAAPQSTHAHEVRPGYLELNALGDDVWDILWKVPAKGDLRLGLYVRLPDRCEGTDPVSRKAGAAHIETWRATCAGDLVGQVIEIDGLAATRTDVLVRVKHADGTTQTLRLTPSEPTFIVAAAQGALDVAKTYLSLGVEHILGGVDHLLFVLALLFLVGNTRKLVGAITAFTVAHSLTLAAATLGWLHVPSAPVEAAIALSIVFVAAEVLNPTGGIARRRPWIIAFVFGLLHGLGFAGALRDVGLPDHAIPVALAFFNLGVEAGQLIFIVAVIGSFKLVAVLFRSRMNSKESDIWAVADSIATPAAYSVGILGSFWLIDRTASFF